MMNQAKEQLAIPSQLLNPHTLQLHRNMYVEVLMKASVTDSERLHFDVSPRDIETALSSLVLTDSRGSTPSIFVHSPVTVNVATAGSEETWTEILTRYQGAKVGVVTSQTTVEGTLVGFRREHHKSVEQSVDVVEKRSKFFIIIRSEHKVSLHVMDSSTSLNFQDQAICEALAEDSFMKQYVVQRRDSYVIDVIAHGKGPGEVEVRYSMWSRYSQGYEVNYVLAADEDEDILACNVRPDRSLKCYFTAHNPLPNNISDVRIVFCSGQRRYNRYYWPYSDLETKPKQDYDTPSVSEGTEAPEELSEEEAEEDFVDEYSEVKSSSTLGENYEYQGNEKHEFPVKVSLKMGESVRMLMFEKKCTGGIIRTVQTGLDDPFASVCVLLHNTTGERLEAGHLYVKSDCSDLSRQFHIFPLAPNEYVLRQLSKYSDVESNVYKQVDIGDVHSCHVSQKQLVAVSEKTKTVMIRIQNKSDKEVGIFVFHCLRSAGRGEGAVEGVLANGRWLHECEGKKIEPYAHSINYRSVAYMLNLGAHETCWMTLRERLTFEEKHTILEDLKSETVCYLEARQLLPADALQSLRRLLWLGRESKRLKLEQSLHRAQLRKIDAYRTRARKNEDGGEGKNERSDVSGQEELQEYLTRSAKAKEARAVLEALMDDNEQRLFEVHSEMAATRRRLGRLTS